MSKIRIENQPFPELVMIIGKCMFVDSLTEYIGPPKNVHY